MKSLNQIAPGNYNPTDAVTPVQVPDMLGTLSQVMQLKSLANQQQLQSFAINEANIKYSDLSAQQVAMQSNQKTDPNTGTTSIDLPGAVSDLNQSNPRAAMSLQSAYLGQLKASADLQNQQNANSIQQSTVIGNAARIVLAAPTQQNFDQVKQGLIANGQSAIVANLGSDITDPQTIQKLQSAALLTENIHDQVADQQAQGHLALDQAQFGQTVNNNQQVLSQRTVNDLQTQGLNFQKQYQQDPQTAEFNKISNGFNQLQTAYNNVTALNVNGAPQTVQGVGDKGLAIGLLKLENPNRSPTSSSIATAEETAGWPDSVRAAVNNAMTGGTLAPAQRDQILAYGQQRLEASRIKQMFVDANYAGRATSAGIPLNMAGLNDNQVLSSPTITPSAYGNGEPTKLKTSGNPNTAAIYAGGGMMVPGTAPAIANNPPPASEINPDGSINSSVIRPTNSQIQQGYQAVKALQNTPPTPATPQQVQQQSAAPQPSGNPALANAVPASKLGQQSQPSVYALPESKVIEYGRNAGLSPAEAVKKWVSSGHHIIAEPTDGQ